MKFRSLTALATTVLILSPTAANAATPLRNDPSVLALVNDLQRRLPDAQFWDSEQHQSSTREAMAATKFSLPSTPIVVNGEYVGLQITRGREVACVLPNPTRVERTWTVVGSGCAVYLSKNSRAIAKANNLAIVKYQAEAIAKRAAEISSAEKHPVLLFADLVASARMELALDSTITVMRNSVVVRSTGKPSATATLTVSGGWVKTRLS